MGNMVEYEQVGYEGSTVVSTTARTKGSWRKIHILADAVFDEYTDANMDGVITGITIKQGTDLYGSVSQFKLTSGSLIAYS